MGALGQQNARPDLLSLCTHVHEDKHGRPVYSNEKPVYHYFIINFPESGIVCDPVSLINYMTVKCTKIPQNAKKWQKHADIFKISAKIYKNMKNLWKYAKNLCKLTSVKSETPTPGHKR